MHMADALLSPAVGATLWAASGVTLALCSKRVAKDERDYLVPLMGVLGAFVFAAQMINFTIPGTGSSGHIGGGLLLAILLGPSAAFVTIASILTMQALFFADGGLLALGANIFNLGAFPCFIAFPLLYQPLIKRAGESSSRARTSAITVLAAVTGLQLGALGVVVETQLSGISSLPLATFLLLMQPIHLAIGLIEGLVTAALVLFVRGSRPDLLRIGTPAPTGETRFPGRMMMYFALAATLTGGFFSWFASAQPDGLEWSIARTTGQPELSAADSALHGRLAALQKQLAPLPGYKFPADEKNSPAETPQASGGEPAAHTEAWPAIDPGASLSGIAGGAGTFLVVMVVGQVLRRRASGRRENAKTSAR